MPLLLSLGQKAIPKQSRALKPLPQASCGYIRYCRPSLRYHSQEQTGCASSALYQHILKIQEAHCMRSARMKDTSINSYTRTLKSFLSWYNREGLTQTNITLYRCQQVVKETYTEESLGHSKIRTAVLASPLSALYTKMCSIMSP